MTTRKKTFDCVAFKRRAQETIYRAIRDMTHEQERAYFEQAALAGPLGDWWKHVVSEHESTHVSHGDS